MFIENLTKEELTYRAHGKVLKLKPGINLVHEVFFQPSDIQKHFGSLVNIYMTNAKRVEEPRKVEHNEKDEKPSSKNDNKGTVMDSKSTDEHNTKPETHEQPNENNGEEKCMDNADNNDTASQETEQGEEETQTKTEEQEDKKDEEKENPEEKSEGSEVEVGETNEGKPEGELVEGEKEDITKLKRPQLMAKYKELKIEGSPAKLSNDALIKAILEKLG